MNRLGLQVQVLRRYETGSTVTYTGR